MTVVHAMAPRTESVRRPVGGPIQGARSGRDRLDRTRRPGTTRPAGAATRYFGTGVAMSAAPHRRRPTSLATTIGLALGAGAITLFLGLMANLGQLANDSAPDSSAHLPTTLSVVRVEPGESLQDVAARVAPDSSAGQVAERIRQLNDLPSSTLVAGQTLIAPVG